MNDNRHLDAKPREPITRWNRRSDIQLTLNLFSRGVRYNPNATTDDLTFVFFTDGARKYKCGRAGTDLHDIRINEDGSVTCFIDRPNFNPGRLHVEVFVTAANSDFTDDDFKICRPSCLPVLIVEGHSDDVDPNVSVALSLPYIEVTIWDALVGHGYLGTSEEFWRKFVGLMGDNSITDDGAIRVVLASMGAEYDGEDVTHEQAPGECVYDGTRYQIAYMDANGDITYYSPSADLIYCNAFTDELYRWNGSGWTTIGGSSTIVQNRYVSGAAVVGNKLILSSTGDGSASTTVVTNVNTLQAKIDELINALANSSFKTERPAQVGELDWDEDIPVVDTYYNVSGINVSSMMYSVSNSATRVKEGTTYINVITAKTGYDLIGVTVNGVSQTITNDTCTINVANVQADIAIVVTARAESVTPSTTYEVGATLTELTMSPSGGSVLAGGTFVAVLALASGVTGKRLPGSITINGTYDSYTYDSDTGALSIVNVQSDITIVATAEESHNHQVSFFLKGCDVVGTQPTEVESGSDLTVTLRKNSSTWPSGEQGGEVAPAQEDFLARDIIVYVGGVPATFSTSQSAADGDISVTVQNVTDDVLISNIVWTAERINSGKTAFIQVGASYVVRYRGSSMIPIGGATSLSVVNNDSGPYGTSGANSGQLGVLFYDQNETFIQCVNSQGHKVMKLTVPSNARYFRMAGNNWYVPKDSNGYGSGGSNTTGIDYAFYIYDDTNGKFVWKGTYVTETINTDNEPTE